VVNLLIPFKTQKIVEVKPTTMRATGPLVMMANPKNIPEIKK
jgi:hypothetical protein